MLRPTLGRAGLQERKRKFMQEHHRKTQSIYKRPWNRLCINMHVDCLVKTVHEPRNDVSVQIVAVVKRLSQWSSVFDYSVQLGLMFSVLLLGESHHMAKFWHFLLYIYISENQRLSWMFVLHISKPQVKTRTAKKNPNTLIADYLR